MEIVTNTCVPQNLKFLYEKQKRHTLTTDIST